MGQSGQIAMDLGQDRVGSSSQSSCLQCKLTALSQELKQMVFSQTLFK